MAYTAIQQDGRRLGNRQAELPYVIHGVGVTDTGDARTAMLADAPSTFEGYGRKDSECEVAEAWSDGTNTFWTGRAVYRAFNDVNDSRFAFGTRGGTTHITVGKAHVASYVASGTAPDHKGLIGVNGDRVDGADIVIPEVTFSESHVFNNDDITTAFKNALAAATGTTNDASFRGYAAGEVLFLGVEGVRDGDDADDFWTLTFYFAVSFNATGLTIGTITSIAKEGWEYLWVEYEPVDDNTANKLVRRPLAVHVERVYDESDYTNLDIG